MFASSNIKYKTSMCKHYQQNGTCNLGLKCHFAHGPEELRTLNDPLPQHVPMNQQRSEPRRPTPNITQNSLPPTIANYKTVKCRFFEKGFCKFAQNCGFAHGDTEIRNQNSPLPQNIANISQNVGSGPQAVGSNPQNQVIQQQISYLIAQMQDYHGSDPEFQAKIKQAQEINDLGNHQGAASLVYEIINRADKSKEDNDNYRTFVQNIQTIQAPSNPVYQQQQQQSYSPQYAQHDAYGMNTTHSQGKSAHPRQQHHQQSQSQPNYSPYETHAQSGSYPESPYHGNQSYKPTSQNYQNYQNAYQGQGNPYQQQGMEAGGMQGLTNMMGNFQPYGNQNYSGYQGGAGQGQHREHREHRG